MPRTGIEPARLVKGHWILSPACLPVPASRHGTLYSNIVRFSWAERSAKIEAVLATKNPDSINPLAFPGYTHPVSKQLHLWHKFSYYALHSWEKVIITLLAVYALTELYKASMFIISDYHSLTQYFSADSTNPTGLSEILGEAIGTMLGTILNIVMALRLTTSQERVSRFIELVLATCLIIWQAEVIQFLQTLNYTILSLSGTF